MARQIENGNLELKRLPIVALPDPLRSTKARGGTVLALNRRMQPANVGLVHRRSPGESRRAWDDGRPGCSLPPRNSK
jgi:hypothetical protein